MMSLKDETTQKHYVRRAPTQFCHLETKADTGRKSSDSLQLITALQRQAGNQYVQLMLNHGLDPLQRQPIEEKEEELQIKPELQRQAEEEEEELQTKPELQRQAEEEEEELQTKPELQRQEEEEEPVQPKEKNSGSHAAPYQAIEASRGQGHSIPQPVKGSLEQSFGYDFSPVRLHSDSQAENLSRDLGARAFTSGQDIFFGKGEYNPASKDGYELMAHEMTHVVQQSNGLEPDAGKPGDKYEQEADAVATHLVDNIGKEKNNETENE